MYIACVGWLVQFSAVPTPSQQAQVFPRRVCGKDMGEGAEEYQLSPEFPSLSDAW